MTDHYRRTPSVTPKPSAAYVRKVDRSEFARQLVQHERLLFAYIYSLVPDLAAAEEVLQETYLRLFERMDEWDPDKDNASQELYAWACAFAHYQVLNYRNRTRRDRLQFGAAFIEKVAALQQAEAHDLDLRLDALENCMDQLSTANQRLLDLAYRGDLAIEQVAEQAERTVLATYQALSRIRKALKQCIERSLRAHNPK